MLLLFFLIVFVLRFGAKQNPKILRFQDFLFLRKKLNKAKTGSEYIIVYLNKE